MSGRLVRSRVPRLAGARARIAAIGSALVVGALALLVGIAGGAGSVEPYQTYESTVTGDAPVTQYRFDDAAGATSLKDSAGTRNATNTGITLAATGPFGGSLAGSFGGSAYATMPSTPLSAATVFSAEAWVYWSGGASYKQPIFDLGSSSTKYMYLTPAASSAANGLVFEIRASSTSAFQVVGPTLAANSWQYVAVTEDANKILRLYVNGQQVGQTTGVTLNPKSLGSTSHNWLGKSQITGDPNFNGRLSNVAFYTKALTASQVLARYNAAEFPVNTTLPTVSGAARDGQSLTVDQGTWTGVAPISYAYQWQRCDGSGNACADVAAATGSNYQLTGGDISSTLRAVVTASNSAGGRAAISNPTAAVVAQTPLNSTAPAISGTVRDGEIVTADRGAWTGTTPISYSYQWRRCDSLGGTCADIAGATDSTFQLSGGDVGQTLRVVVAASNTAGSATATSSATAAVAAQTPANTTAPSISGTARDGQTLSADKGSWSGTAPISYAYQWRRCDSTGGGCVDIAGATSSAHELGGDDVGATVRVVVSATNAAGTTTATSSASAVVTGTSPANTAAPSVSGTARDGQTLTADEGTWSGTAPISYAYQWRRCDSSGTGCTDIAGATDSTYQLSGGDVGATVRVVVVATNASGSSTATSAPSVLVAPQPPANTAAPSISGTARDGQTLTADRGAWSGTSPLSYAYQWRRCDGAGDNCSDIAGATDATYQLTGSDVGATLRVAVTATNAADSTTATSAATNTVLAAPPASTTAPSISGVARDGQTLSAEKGAWSGTTPISYSYQWQRCDGTGAVCADITGATDATYQLAAADVDATLRAVVTASNAAGASAAISPVSDRVAGTPPSNTAAPSISGTARDGQTLTADAGAWSGTAPIGYGYQWRRCDASGVTCTDISGATASTYQLATGDVGGTVRVVVTANNASGSSSATSAASTLVTPAPPANTAAPAIAGTPRDGETMTTDKGTWSGTAPISYSYQWRRCDGDGTGCADIPGATGPTYDVDGGDVDATLRVVVTATNAADSVSMATAASDPVLAAPPAEASAPAIAGTLRDGQTLTTDDGTWAGTGPMSYAHQWRRCDADGAGCADIAGATGAGYELTGADIDATVRVVITAANAAGAASSTSPPSGVVAPAAPANTTAPSISGSAHAGQTLSTDNGSWSGSSPMSYAHRWQRCDAAGVGCIDVNGATLSTYEVRDDDVGSTLRVVVTATNAADSAAASSTLSAIVTASAPVARTIIDSPGSGVIELNTYNPSIQVSGRAPGLATGDQVDIGCFRGGEMETSEETTTIGSDGSFSATVGIYNPEFSGTCRLLAVPRGQTTADDSFSGPLVTFEWNTALPPTRGTGTPYDYLISHQQPGGWAQYNSMSTCGLCAMALLIDPITGQRSQMVFYGNAYLLGVEFDWMTRTYRRAGVIIDDHAAYTTSTAASSTAPGAADPAWEPPTWTRTVDPATGDMTIEEHSDFYRCNTDTLPPSKTENCSALTREPVALVRRITQSHDGAQVRIDDSYRSTDGEAHAVDLDYGEDQVYEDSRTLYLAPSADGATYRARDWGDAITDLPENLNTLYIKSDTAPDGDANAPQGAITTYPSPKSITFRDNIEAFFNYARTVPAQGDETLTRVYNMANNTSDLQRAASASECSLRPADYESSEEDVFADCNADTTASIDDSAFDDQACYDDQGDDAPCPNGTFEAASTSPFGWGISDNNPITAFNIFDNASFQALGVKYARQTVAWNVALQPEGTPALENIRNWVVTAIQHGVTPLISFERCTGTFMRNDPALPDNGQLHQCGQKKVICDDRAHPPSADDLAFAEGDDAARCLDPNHPVHAIYLRAYPPSQNEYRHAVEAFLSYDRDNDPATLDLKDVHEFTPWNEPNLRGYQPTAVTSLDQPPRAADPAAEEAAHNTWKGVTLSRANKKAWLAGRYWWHLQDACNKAPVRCTVAAGDFTDGWMPNAKDTSSAGGQYYRFYRVGMQQPPKVWAWHAYQDSERAPFGWTSPSQRWSAIKAFLARTHFQTGTSPRVWLTEQGAVAIRSTTVRIGSLPPAACAIIGGMLDDLVHLNTRIQRFYYYQLIGERRNDSGLLDYVTTEPRNYLYDQYKARIEGSSPPPCI